MARAIVLLKLTREGAMTIEQARAIYEETKIFFTDTGYKIVDLYATWGNMTLCQSLKCRTETPSNTSFAAVCWRRDTGRMRFARCRRCRLRSFWVWWMSCGRRRLPNKR
jgi:hypothetical protein